MFNLEFELTQNDFINLGRDMLTISKFRKPYMINAGIGIILLYIISIIIFRNWQGLVYPSLIAIIVIYVILNNGRSMYKNAKDVDLMRKFEFKDEGYTLTTNNSVTNFAYESIKELYNTPHSLIFIDKNGIMQFIPKRVVINLNLYNYLQNKVNM